MPGCHATVVAKAVRAASWVRVARADRAATSVGVPAPRFRRRACGAALQND